MIKKLLMMMSMSFILVSGLYADVTQLAIEDYRQKEAKKWFQKAIDASTAQLAIEYYTKAIELNPEYAEAYYKRGTAYYNLKEYDKAIADYNKAMELDPKYAEISYNPAIAHCIKNDPERAIEKFTKAVKLNPKDAEAYYRRGCAYADKGDYDQAIKDYTRAIELDPNFAEAYNSRGIAYSKKGDHDRAIKDYTKAIELEHKDSGAHSKCESAYYHKDSHDVGKPAEKTVTSFEPEYENDIGFGWFLGYGKRIFYILPDAEFEYTWGKIRISDVTEKLEGYYIGFGYWAYDEDVKVRAQVGFSSLSSPDLNYPLYDWSNVISSYIKKVNFFEIDASCDYLFLNLSNKKVSPYIGGGISIGQFSVETTGDYVTEIIKHYMVFMRSPSLFAEGGIAISIKPFYIDLQVRRDFWGNSTGIFYTGFLGFAI